MNFQYPSLILACVSLIVSAAALIYIVKTSRQTRYIRDELSEKQRIGGDAWVAKHVQHWRDGKLASRIEKGIGVSGSDVEIIEPLPGWKIVVATLEGGKRIDPVDQTH